MPSFEEIKKEAVGLSSDIGLAMELNLKDILGKLEPTVDFLLSRTNFRGERRETLGAIHRHCLEFRRTLVPAKLCRWHRDNQQVSVDPVYGFNSPRYISSLYQISYSNSRLLNAATRCDDEIKKVVLLSYNQQHQWRLFKEKMEIVPLLMGDMDDLRGKLGLYWLSRTC